MRNKGLSFYKKKKKISQALLREIFSWIFGIALSVFLAGVIVIFLGRSARVVGMSMEPTLENGQQIYIDRFTYILSSPKAGDVVAFLPMAMRIPIIILRESWQDRGIKYGSQTEHCM